MPNFNDNQNTRLRDLAMRQAKARHDSWELIARTARKSADSYEDVMARWTTQLQECRTELERTATDQQFAAIIARMG